MKNADQLHALLGFWVEYSLAQNIQDKTKSLDKCKETSDKFFKKYKISKLTPPTQRHKK